MLTVSQQGWDDHLLDPLKDKLQGVWCQLCSVQIIQAHMLSFALVTYFQVCLCFLAPLT